MPLCVAEPMNNGYIRDSVVAVHHHFSGVVRKGVGGEKM